MTLDHSYLLALGQWKEKTRVLTHEIVLMYIMLGSN